MYIGAGRQDGHGPLSAEKIRKDFDSNTELTLFNGQGECIMMAIDFLEKGK